MFDVKTDSGVASAVMTNLGYMDAATVGEIAAIELGIDSITVNDAPRHERRAPCVLTISTNPATMSQMALLMLDKLGTPAFNQREWLLIADVLGASNGIEAVRMAVQIRSAYKVEA